MKQIQIDTYFYLPLTLMFKNPAFFHVELKFLIFLIFKSN